MNILSHLLNKSYLRRVAQVFFPLFLLTFMAWPQLASSSEVLVFVLIRTFFSSLLSLLIVELVVSMLVAFPLILIDFAIWEKSMTKQGTNKFDTRHYIKPENGGDGIVTPPLSYQSWLGRFRLDIDGITDCAVIDSATAYRSKGQIVSKGFFQKEPEVRHVLLSPTSATVTSSETLTKDQAKVQVTVTIRFKIVDPVRAVVAFGESIDELEDAAALVLSEYLNNHFYIDIKDNQTALVRHLMARIEDYYPAESPLELLNVTFNSSQGLVVIQQPPLDVAHQDVAVGRIHDEREEPLKDEELRRQMEIEIMKAKTTLAKEGLRAVTQMDHINAEPIKETLQGMSKGLGLGVEMLAAGADSKRSDMERSKLERMKSRSELIDYTVEVSEIGRIVEFNARLVGCSVEAHCADYPQKTPKVYVYSDGKHTPWDISSWWDGNTCTLDEVVKDVNSNFKAEQL